MEFLPLSFEFCKLKLCIAVFYRPPSSDVTYFANFCNAVENLDVNFSNFILAGDFNIEYFNTAHHLYSRLKCLWELLLLHQVVTEPTYLSSHGNETLIDHVYLSNISQFVSCSVLPTVGSSDHNCIDIVLQPKGSDVRKKTKIHHVIWKYALADSDRGNEMLKNMNVDEFNKDNMDKAWSRWKEQFTSVMRQCIPTVQKSPPWLSHDLLRAIRLRNISYRRARQTGKPNHLER